MIWGYFVLGYGVAGDDVRKSTKVGFLLEVLRNAVDARSQPYWIGHAPDPDDARAHPVPPPEALAFSRISAVMT